MLVGSVVVLVESSPISPFPLYPTVYTSPKSSAIADVWYDGFFVLAIVIIFLSSCTFVKFVLDTAFFVYSCP